MTKYLFFQVFAFINSIINKLLCLLPFILLEKNNQTFHFMIINRNRALHNKEKTSKENEIGWENCEYLNL